MEIHTNPLKSDIYLSEKVHRKAPVILYIPRSQNEITVLVQSDSIKKYIHLSSHFIPFKRFMNHVYIDSSSTKTTNDYNDYLLLDLTQNTESTTKPQTNMKGVFYVKASNTFIHFEGFDNGKGFKNYNAIPSLSIGLDYCYSNASFLSFTGMVASNYVTIGERIGINPDIVTQINTESVRLMNNHKFEIFRSKDLCLNLGYGLSFVEYSYRQYYGDTIKNRHFDIHRYSSSAIGLSVEANILFLKYYFIGINALPSFYSANVKKFDFSYYSSIYFGVRFPLGNKTIHKLIYRPKYQSTFSEIK